MNKNFEELAIAVDFETLARELDNYAEYLRACYNSADDEGVEEKEKMRIFRRLNSAVRMRNELTTYHDV